MARFSHPTLDEPVDAIAGHYTLTARLIGEHRGDRLLWFKGVMLIDTACCGMGGCGYALVAGVLAGDSGDGPVSEVRLISDPAEQSEIRRWLIAGHSDVTQVVFHVPSTAS